MEIKLPKFTLEDIIKMACKERHHFYKDQDPCYSCPFHNTEECLAKENATDKHYIGGGACGTFWNSQQGPDGYLLQFETDDKALYDYMVQAARKCIDVAHKCPIKKYRKKKKTTEEK